MVEMAALALQRNVHRGLPAPRVDDTHLQLWIEMVSQRVSTGASGTATVHALRNEGLLTGDGRVITGQPDPDTDIFTVTALARPPDPQGFTAQAGIRTAALFWSNPFRFYRNHAHTEVWRHTADEFNNATMLGTSPGISYVDRQVEPGMTYYYWIRWVTSDAAPIIGDPSSSIEVTTAVDPETAIEALATDLADDPLTRDLLSPIVVDAGGQGGRAIAVSEDIAHRSAVITALLLNDVSNGVEMQVGQHSLDIAALEARVAGVSLGPMQNVFAGADRAAAEAARDAYAAANAAWLAQYDADDTLNIRLVYGVVRQFQTRAGGAWVNNGEEEPTVAAISSLNVQAAQNAAAIMVNAQSLTALSASIGGLATATALQELTVRVQQTENVAGDTELSTLARWLVKTQVNGLVGGVGLYNDGDTVRFYVAADRFAILPPGAQDTAAQRVPFAVVDGVVYMDAALIRDGTITSLKAENAFLTNMTAVHGRLASANIGVLEADNIGANTIDASTAIFGELSAEHIAADVRNAVVLWQGELETDMRRALPMNENLVNFDYISMLGSRVIDGDTRYVVTGVPAGVLETGGLNTSLSDITTECVFPAAAGEAAFRVQAVWRSASGDTLYIYREGSGESVTLRSIVGFRNPPAP